jgi:Flp pilus assembly protein TadD
MRTNAVAQAMVPTPVPSKSAIVPTTAPVVYAYPLRVRNLIRVAKTQFALHRYDSTVAYSLQALSLAPTNPDAWYLKATAEDVGRHRGKAAIAYANFLKFAPEQLPQYQSLITYAKDRLAILQP